MRSTLTVCLVLLGWWPLAVPAVADPIEGFQLQDYHGRDYALNDFADSDHVVLAFLGTECPLAKLYASRLQQLSEEFANQGVAFVGVNPNVQDSLTEIAAYARRHGVKFPILKDLGNKVADQLRVTRTPEIVVLDRERNVRYRGRVDDQFVIGVNRDVPSREDLRVALQELVAGKAVTVTTTEAIGCLIGRVREVQEGSEVTYANQISRIFNRRCVSCHRDGDIGPFSLTTYDDTEGWGDMIVEVVRERRMPPWHANPDHGDFANDSSLTEEEIGLIEKWVKSGCPKGDTSKLPPTPEFTDGWQMPEEPELIIAMDDKPFVVPATAGPAGVPYQYLTVKSGFEEDKWIRHAEVQPGNKSVVHHIIVYAIPPGERHRGEWIFLTAYVPGLRYDPMPERSAKRIPAGSTLLFEQHYTPVGSEQTDISRLGLVFADPNKISHEVVTVEISNDDFRIPPRSGHHVVTCTSRPIRRSDMQLISLSPHMHLRGKAFRYELAHADGTREVLLDVPGYDFNWQTRYVLSTPRRLPVGSVIHCRAAFDNSETNLANPDPSRSVTFGEQSWDEMMIGFADVMVPKHKKHSKANRLVDTGYDTLGEFDRIDADGNRVISPIEAQQHETLKNIFAEVDFDSNGQVDLQETIRAVGDRDDS